jgi:hypothetical protein
MQIPLAVRGEGCLNNHNLRECGKRKEDPRVGCPNHQVFLSGEPLDNRASLADAKALREKRHGVLLALECGNDGFRKGNFWREDEYLAVRSFWECVGGGAPAHTKCEPRTTSLGRMVRGKPTSVACVWDIPPREAPPMAGRSGVLFRVLHGRANARRGGEERRERLERKVGKFLEDSELFGREQRPFGEHRTDEFQTARVSRAMRFFPDDSSDRARTKRHAHQHARGECFVFTPHHSSQRSGAG